MLTIGIGASAGGLDAFKSFFATMPSDSGMAFILIQHLNPEHKSILAELIAARTAMTVMEAEDGVPITPNTVFVISPDSTLTIDQGRLCVERPAPPRSTRHPIDSFLKSLAESQEEEAVGIILAGTGSDGSAGIRAIKEYGGLTLAQAGYDHLALDGMPRSAVATGLVDHVLRVEDMPARLVDYERTLKRSASGTDPSGAPLDMARHLATINALLRNAIGHDFARYKQSTLGRRVERRMRVLNIGTVPEFIERLRRDPQQLQLLFGDFLIGVTQFFRDPEAFEALRAKGLAPILARARPRDTLRIWIPACATGEEVYSIAILLMEEMERAGLDLAVQIFGTDIDDGAIATARAAHYPQAMTGMSAARIERWFVPHGDGYCPIKQIREMCVFSVHSIIKDPPFSRVDLISCRNLMIYLEIALQERVAHSFHYALRPGGILFLGPSEGLMRSRGLFTLLDKRHRVFERRATDATRPEFSMMDIAPDRPRLPALPPAKESDDVIDRHARAILENYCPAYVVIDQQHDVVRFSGGSMGAFLEPASGPPALNLFTLLRKSLRPSVRAAVQKVFLEGRMSVQKQVSIRIGGESHLLRIVAAPLSAARTEPGLCLVGLQDLGAFSKKRGPHSAEDGKEHSDEELQIARAQISTLTAELEAANEDMASSAEEYQSINEELQSSNEELETAKEEMQSINEELQTVNAEMNSKNDQLMRSNSDLQNLLDSTQIATIFLDADLKVKGYTPGMTQLFHLRETDRGRPLDEIVSRIVYGDLHADVLAVLRDLTAIEREVEIADGSVTFLMRIRPYRTLEDQVDGVVITFVDISGRKQMEDALREHAAIVQFSPDALVSMTLDGVIRSWNPGAERLFGYLSPEVIGKPIGFLVGLPGDDRQRPLFDSARAGQTVGPVDTVWHRRGGDKVNIEYTIIPIRRADGGVTALALAARDIAGRIAADSHRALLLRELSHRVKNALATVQAIARQTLGTAPTPQAFAESFSARLMALAKTHDLLTQGEWQGAALHDIVGAELSPYQNETRTHWTGSGPDIQLGAKAALAIGMALHELATNAAKYGALSVPGGHVALSWDRLLDRTGPRLHILWSEHKGPPVRVTGRKGFGTRLICEGLAYELEGEVKLDFDPAGVRCAIDVPLSRQEDAL